MSADESWKNAKVCARAALATSDPIRRDILVHLAEFWLTLAHHDTSQITEATAVDLAVIEQAQANILGAYNSALY